MSSEFRKIVNPMEGDICELADDRQSGSIRMTSVGREHGGVFDFVASTRRRVCQIGLTQRKTSGTAVVQSDDSNPLIWVPVDSPFRTTDYPTDGKVLFELSYVHDLKTGRKVKMVGPWASYKESLYVLTTANAVHLMIKDNCGKKVWKGVYGLGTGCRIDSWGAFPSDLFSCGEIFMITAETPWPVASKRNVYNDLRNAQVLVEEPEEEQRTTTGRRAM